MNLQKIGIIGCGTMGAGIVQVLLLNGYTVAVNESNKTFLSAGIERVDAAFSKLEKKEKLTAAQIQEMKDRLIYSVDLATLSDCDLVIEAVFEDLEVKKGLFEKLDCICKPETVLASNTSSLSITEMSAFTQRPEKFVGLHFFNPVPFNKLVEVIRTLATPNEIIERLKSFVDSLKKTAVIAQDNAGFIVNSLLTPFMLDAMRAAGNQLASVRDIDTAMKLGCSHPMGPLMLADFIGLDVIYKASNNMFEEYTDTRYAPPPILKKMVLSRNWGLKTGKGFYDWSDIKKPEPVLINQ